MSCSPQDLRDYFFNELLESDRRSVDIHLRSCQNCREEVERLRATEAALLAARDEEPPQRIAFISDKVFEPSALRRWWRDFWGSAARLGFASAAMLSAAIVFAALTRPAPLAPPSPPRAELARLEAEFSARLQQAVKAAVSESEARQAARTDQVLAAAERRYRLEREAILLAASEDHELMRKRYGRMVLASMERRDEK